MLTLHIEAENILDLRAKVDAALVSAQVLFTEPADDNNEQATEPKPAAAGRKPRRGRKPKAEQQQAAQPAVASNTGTGEKAPSPSPETPSQDGDDSNATGDAGNDVGAPAVPTADEFRAHLQKVASDENIENAYEKVSEVVQKAGYAKLKDVKPEDYASIMAKCDEVS